jgi:hypothetical protein
VERELALVQIGREEVDDPAQDGVLGRSTQGLGGPPRKGARIGVDRHLSTAIATRIATSGVIPIRATGLEKRKRPCERAVLQVLPESPERDSNS